MGTAVFTCVLGTAAVLCIIFERQLTVFEAFIAARCRRSDNRRQTTDDRQQMTDNRQGNKKPVGQP